MRLAGAFLALLLCAVAGLAYDAAIIGQAERAAAMKDANSGCGAKGFDFSSG
jgi:cytochrome c556